ncbi:MAG TPA: MATE family efflux transporter [Candidatus Limnocylindrales bacterium]|nr:MATE family efflux transporter [Candidatus Limnocylindrales bacterium]
MSLGSADEIEIEEAPAPSARASELAKLSPARAALELAWPGIIEQSIGAASTAIVFALVGHLGAVATAGVGAAGSFLFLMFPVWRSLAIGTIAIVSRRMGEGNAEEAADATRQSLLLGALAGVAFGIGFVLFSEPLLRLLGATDDVVAVGAPFLRVIGAASGASTLWLIGTSAMRAAGDTRTPMYLSAVGSIFSVVLAYVLINVVGTGPMGAAYAQTIGWLFGMSAMFVLLWRGVAGLSIAGGTWRLTMTTVRRIFAISIPSAAESATFSFGILALSGLVFRLGTEHVAAHQIISQIETFSFFPCIGFSSAASALVGQALGMRDRQRAVGAGWASMQMALVWASIAGLAFIVAPGFLMGLFTDDPAVRLAGLGALAVVGLGQPAQAAIFALGGALRGAGDTRYPLIVSLVNWFLIRLPLAYVLAFPFGFGLTGIWMGVSADYFVRAALLALRFRSGAWARVRV